MIVDTNGAGDALVGGFISGLMRGFNYDLALMEGIQLAQLVIQRNGCDLNE